MPALGVHHTTSNPLQSAPPLLYLHPHSQQPLDVPRQDDRRNCNTIDGQQEALLNGSHQSSSSKYSNDVTNGNHSVNGNHVTADSSTNHHQHTVDSSTNHHQHTVDSSTNHHQHSVDSSTDHHRHFADSSTNHHQYTADSSTNHYQHIADSSTNHHQHNGFYNRNSSDSKLAAPNGVNNGVTEETPLRLAPHTPYLTSQLRCNGVLSAANIKSLNNYNTISSKEGQKFSSYSINNVNTSAASSNGIGSLPCAASSTNNTSCCVPSPGVNGTVSSNHTPRAPSCPASTSIPSAALRGSMATRPHMARGCGGSMVTSSSKGRAPTSIAAPTSLKRLQPPEAAPPTISASYSVCARQQMGLCS